MEEKHEEAEDVESCSSDSFIVDSDDDEPSTSGQDDGTIIEKPLTEKEIEELVAEFLEVESKAAEAQEALEKESLNKVESEVREELAQTLQGDELEAAIKDEMNAFKEEWENTLDELETESAHLLEQLDGAGIELPSLYKWIESQVPDGCCTEAWKRRALWVGSQMTSEINEAVANAEKYLHVHRPVRRRHGKLLEEGASGFLEKKFAAEGSNEALAENAEVDWPSLKKFFSGNVSEDVATFGSKHWASVYLANTPQEAAMLGVKFPGLNEIEEIEDIDADSNDPFVVDAIENERELVLSEEQRRNYRKVKEEDDVKSDRKLQLRLRKRINHKRSKQAVTQRELGCVEGVNRNNLDVLSCSNGHPHIALDERGRNGEDMPEISEISGNHREKKSTSNGNLGSSESPLPDVIEPRGSKRPNEGEESNEDGKRQRTIMSNNDSESDIEKDQPAFDGIKVDDQSTLQGNTGDHGAEESLNEKFNCTACNSVAEEVHPHPLLKVIICKDCKLLIDEKKHVEDSDCSLSYCEWCGRTGDFISCRSCKRLFCIACIQRNIDDECLSKVQGSRWQCCCCSPSQIQRLTSQLEEAIETDDCMVTSSDSDSETSDPDIGVSISSKRKRKKKIRRILDDAELGEETKRKIAIEKERQDRLKSLKVQFSGRSKLINPLSFSGKLPEGASVEVLGDAMTGYIVNVVREEGEEAVRIPPSISAKLKAHQVAGIRFLWENIIQSIGKVKSGDKGLGCILAHTMGLGKTFQVIAFLYTAMRSVDLGLRTALIVTPVSVLHNWRREFMKWNPAEVKPLRVLMLEDVQREKRAELLAKWRAKGGIFLISYTSFRNLFVGKNVKDRNVAKEISSALQDGPDILVCDEAHMIKNTRADTTQALKQVKCQRRIALTGSPLQNNLMEYYCMVDFVREGFLGSSHEFRNRFQNPIENGQHTNSTADDVKTMNQRSHILYEQLKGFVQRMDMSVVKKDLPPKTVFVIAVKLSPLQRKLYKRFLDVHGFTNGRVSNEKMRKSFFAGYQALAQILNHPGILQLRKDKYDSCREDAAENLLADECSSDENVDFNTVIGEKTRNANFVPAKHDDGFLQKDWWNDLLEENNYKERDFSGKMVLLLDILTMSSEVGDKTLVFSQSIPTLDLIELHLSRLSRHGKKGKFWRRGKDWYRLDGRTESSERQKLVERFNDPANKRVKCSLISTRAGSLGINLYAANRVVIVDGSWNPTYDLQAIYRAWRYGQTKPVFAYRLMAHGTMEEKIYKRQVTKEGLAARVVDRQQINRTISREEMLHLFDFGDEENTDALADLSQEERLADSLYMTNRTGNPVKQKVDLSMASCSSDKLMETLLGKHDPRWIANYHEHETLLQENEDEKLTKEEQDMAWEVYRKSLEWEEEVLRTPVGESAFEQKPPMPNVVPPAPIIGSQRESRIAPPAPDPPGIVVAQSMLRRGKMQRRCTNLAHMLTLRSQGTKVGCVTVCGECAREISWEDLSGNAGMPR